MTRTEANELLPKGKFWRHAMAKALSLHPWLNTPEEAERLKALKVLGYNRKTK